MRTYLAAIALLTVLAGPLMAGDFYTKDGQYDFFGLARYPEGGKLVDGVERYKVVETGGTPQDYERRVVQWWPRKGVDIIEVQEGMIEREWTRVPSMLEEPGSLDTEAEITVQDEAVCGPRRENDQPVQFFIRRIRGYLHPPEDDNYRVMVSADTMGFFFVSPDEKPENKELMASLTSYSRFWQFDKFGTQISKPIPMKQGRKYYYEIIHYQMEGGNHLETSWEGEKMPRLRIGPDHVSTMDGRMNKVEVEYWKVSDGGGVRAMDLPRTFRAHLIGFDGAGNEVGYPDPKEDFAAPDVILRMEDGRMRSMAARSLSRADQEFIIGVYAKEMQRVRATLDKTVYTVRPETVRSFPGGTPLGEPGTWLKQSEHMVVPSGSQGTAPWLNVEDPDKGARYRDSIFSSYENMHAFLEYGGHLMPYWDRTEQYKYEGRTGGTIRNGYERVGSGPGGGYGGQGLIPDVKPGGGFAHEYGHGFSLQWNFTQDGEILANAVMDIVGGGVVSDNSIQRPWRNCLHGSYVTTLFYRFIGMDPNWGLCAMAAVPMGVGEVSFFQTIARVGQQRGVFEDGIRGVGDMVGDYGARLPEFDYLWQEQMRMNHFAAARNILDPVDPEQGVYRIPWDEAPEAFGVNIVRLVPEEGGKVIEVDFEGFHDPIIFSDWRACIVAVDKDGKARYSDLWNKGIMRMPREDGDLRYWLTVAATPAALSIAGSSVHYGQYAPRYPWQVTLRGAVPGTPHPMRTDLDDVYCAYGPKLRSGTVLPAIPNSEPVRQFVERAGAYLDEMQTRMRNARTQVEEINSLQMVGRVREALSATEGAPHPYGGGWVVASAEVAPTAYVGPNALVLGEAKVLDHAIIEDYAVLMNSVVVSGHARVGGRAILEEGTTLTGYQRAWFPIRQPAENETPELTNTRGGEENGLWAHYAMDQAEAVLLEDYYRGRDSGNEFFFSLPNGYLHGRPEFVREDGYKGFSFDGKTQYAELNRRAADLGAITVDMTVKWQGQGEQILLDCGSGLDHRFTLTTGGKGGGVMFAAIVDGSTVAELTSSIALVKDVWTRVRLEIDGQKIAVWIDDKPAGEMASGFRPADAFKAGAAQRNFIASGRDGKGRFKGVYDRVVIYHTVYGDAFTGLPAPLRDAPRRPEKGFAREARLGMGMSAFEQADRKARIAEAAMEHWNARASGAKTRIMELHHRVPEYLAAVEEAKAFEKWKADSEAGFRTAFDERPESVEVMARVAEIAERVGALNAKINALPKPAPDQVPTLAEPTPEMLELQEKIAPLEARLAKLEEVEKQARAAVAALPESMAAQEEIARLQEEIKPLAASSRKKLADAEASDEEVQLRKATPDMKYVRAHDRVMRSLGAGGGLQFMVREKLKAADPEFREWADMTERVEELQREEIYRLYDHLLRHTDHPSLLPQNRWDRGELEQTRRELNGLKQQLQNHHRDAGQSEEALALLAERASLQEESRRLTGELNTGRSTYVDGKMLEAGLNEKMAANEDRLKAAAEAVSKQYHAELHILYSFLRQNFHGFYNAPISTYVGRYADNVVGGAVQRDNLDFVSRVEDMYAPDKWKTSVDQWDWRTKWEVDGTIKDLPLTRKWLARVRGE